MLPKKNLIKNFYIFLILIIQISLISATEYPCPFMDSVNITGSYPVEIYMENATHTTHNDVDVPAPASNVSYMYKWTMVPRTQVALYDFVIINGVRKSSAKHLRACVCNLKPCIRFCCSPGYFYNLRNKSCLLLPANNTDDVDEYSLGFRYLNGSVSNVNVSSNHFAFTHGIPCVHMGAILKDNSRVNWILYENGSIIHRHHLFPRNYCYSPLPLQIDKFKGDEAGYNWHWEPLACLPERLPFILGVREWTYAICLILTVICMIVVLFVYLICTEIRNTFFGVAIKTYCLCIIIGYSLLAHLTLTSPADMSRYACSKIPLFVLLYIILSFYILTFISFNFYLCFFGIILSKLMFWFVFFPLVLLAAGWSFFVSFTTYNNKTVFGGDTCWFDPRNYSIVVYFYVPIMVACIFSGIFYILSLLRQNEMAHSDATKMAIFTTKNRFQSFWKFFSYSLITWIVCACSFAVNTYRGDKTHINYVVCLFIGFHGVGAMYALIGKNQQVQHFFRHIEDDEDSDDMAEISVPMTTY